MLFRNIFYDESPDCWNEFVSEDDLYFTCCLIEEIARHLKQPNKYVVNSISYRGLSEIISVASVLHCENIKQVVHDMIKKYNLQTGSFDVLNVSDYLCPTPPTTYQIGRVYEYLIVDTEEQRTDGQTEENYVEGILRVYNHPICDVIDDYNCSGYFEPPYVLVRAYKNGGVF